MNFMTKKGALLVLLILLIMPYLAIAQHEYKPSPESISDNILVDGIKEKHLDKLKSNLNHAEGLADMPIYDPESNALIRIYHPPKKLVYNMPIIGRKDTCKLKFDLHTLQKYLFEDEGKNPN